MTRPWMVVDFDMMGDSIKERMKWQTTLRGMVGRRRLTASKSVLKAPMLSALETILS